MNDRKIYLVNEHEDYSSITKSIFGEERECIGMIEKFITKSPVNGSSRRNR